MAAFTYSNKDYLDWIKNSREYKSAPANSPLKDLNSDVAKQTYRKKYAQFLKTNYGDDAVKVFLKEKPVTESPVGGSNVVPPVVPPLTQHSGLANFKAPMTVQQFIANNKRGNNVLKEGSTFDELVSKYKGESDAQRGADKTKTDDALLKSEKAGTSAALALDSLKGITGIGQTIAGIVMNKKLKSQQPKEPQAPLTTAFDTRLAQAAADSQMADPVIRQKLLSDLVNQKRYMDEVGRVSSGGDVTAYAAQAQANAGNLNKSYRDIAFAETQDKMGRQGIYDRLLGRKMQNDNNLYNTKMQKYLGVDIPDFQARRSYTQNLTNQGLSNTFGALGSAIQGVQPAMLQNQAQKDPVVKNAFVNMLTNGQSPYYKGNNTNQFGGMSPGEFQQWLLANGYKKTR